ncbi:acyltransferase family protein, partial [Aliivibrio kagoshimensis]|uniref:acyltransferase family protein n=1 Tax=Aliivibrio kagoshimensis TaxID=2910230 RepID=UPI003D0DDFC6
MIITKYDSNYLKGIAILLMLFHHLFAFPDRIPATTDVIYIFTSINFESKIALFGKICVPLFFFISGYGFSSVNNSSPKYYINKIIQFYKSYWLVFIFFIPVFFIVNDTKFDLKELVLNIISLRSSYNSEWWFIKPYIFLVLLTPLIRNIRLKTFTLASISILLFLLSFLIRKFNIDIDLISLNQLFFWQPAFISGYLLATYRDSKV